MERLILNNGAVIENGSAGLSDNFLWLWLPNWTIRQAVEIVFDPFIMERIIYVYGEELDVTYSGYTKCVSIMQESEDLVSICMKKE